MNYSFTFLNLTFLEYSTVYAFEFTTVKSEKKINAPYVINTKIYADLLNNSLKNLVIKNFYKSPKAIKLP
jgi:hypothetical protein